jgi:HK97 family phage major capsid protein
MMYHKIRELREQRASLWERCKALLDIAEAENRNLTAEEEAEWKRLEGEIDELEVRYKRLEQSLERDAEMVQVEQPLAGRRSGGEQEQRGIESDEYRNAFSSYLRVGMQNLNPEQRTILSPHFGGFGESRALATGTAGAGGALVAPEFYTRLLEAMEFIGGVRTNGVTILSTTTGADLAFPMANNLTLEGEQIGENVAVTEENVTFATTNLGAYIYSSKMIRIPYTLLQDSAFDVEAYVIRHLGERIGRITNRRFTNGTGAGQPQGIVTAAPMGHTGPVEYDSLVELEHSIDPSHRSQARFMFHDQVLKALKLMKDGEGRPIWLPGVAVREPDRILGYSYGLNQHMAHGSGKKSILFGRMAAYFIRDVTDFRIMRLQERFAEFLQVAFLGFSRHDGKLIEAGDKPVKALVEA